MFRLCLAMCLLVPAAARAQAPVAAIVESSLKTAGGNIRQLAFDGNPDSYFASASHPGKDDHFTVIFDQPVAIRAIEVTTGKPKGGDTLEAGVLEFSADGKKFDKLAEFVKATAHAKLENVKAKAIRIRPTADLGHPLAIREIAIQSEPKVAAFKHPIEFTVDASEAPDLKEWAEKTARVCERNYAMICDELASDGFKPRTQISMTIKKDYNGVAYASGGRIVGSAKYFKTHQDDVGAMIHETVHCVQSYRTRGPGWLVEGIADYVRFFKYEPGKIGRIAKDPHYDGSYRTTAAFLNFAAEKYDKELVKKINKAMREGEYREEMWKALTKKTLKELDEEWRASMKKGAAGPATDRLMPLASPFVTAGSISASRPDNSGREICPLW